MAKLKNVVSLVASTRWHHTMARRFLTSPSCPPHTIILYYAGWTQP